MTSFDISFMHTALIIACAISTIMVGECKSETVPYKKYRHFLVLDLQITDIFELGLKALKFENKIKIFEKAH